MTTQTSTPRKSSKFDKTAQFNKALRENGIGADAATAIKREMGLIPSQIVIPFEDLFKEEFAVKEEWETVKIRMAELERETRRAVEERDAFLHAISEAETKIRAFAGANDLDMKTAFERAEQYLAPARLQYNAAKVKAGQALAIESDYRVAFEATKAEFSIASKVFKK